jgi:hypothetical protein
MAGLEQNPEIHSSTPIPRNILSEGGLPTSSGQTLLFSLDFPHNASLEAYSLTIQTDVIFKSPEPIPQRNPHTCIPDVARWPDTYGYPAIHGGSGKEDTPEHAQFIFEWCFNDEVKEVRWRIQPSEYVDLDEARRARSRLLEAVRLYTLYPQVFEETYETRLQIVSSLAERQEGQVSPEEARSFFEEYEANVVSYTGSTYASRDKRDIARTKRRDARRLEKLYPEIGAVVAVKYEIQRKLAEPEQHERERQERSERSKQSRKK